jgi:hypothetical protein
MFSETLPRYCVGPSAYGAPKLPPPGGGKFSTAVAKSDIDWMVYVGARVCFAKTTWFRPLI